MKNPFVITAAAIARLLPGFSLLLWVLLARNNLGHPAFFRQVRSGLHGYPFKMVKARVVMHAREPAGALLPDADRLKLFERFLRASSLDEWAGSGSCSTAT